MNYPLSGADKEENFNQIYEHFVNDIYRLCFSFMKNTPDTEDAVQETFIRLYQSNKEFESEKHLYGWLIVTASNLCKDQLKSWWQKRKSLDEIDDTIGREQDIDEMMELIMKLPDRYKTIIFLYYYEGYNSAEIADLLHKSKGTVRWYLKKARELLKAELQGGYVDGK